MKTVAIKTLGCKVNSYESEAIGQLFESAGYKIVASSQVADVYVVNTCTVTNTGDKKSRQEIRKLIRLNPEAVIAVVGCYAQVDPEAISEIAGVDIILGTQGRENIVEYVEKFLESRQPIVNVSNIIKQKQFEDLNIVSFESKTRAFIKIQEGCNNFCTFCIIPWARGLMRSQSPEKVINQIKLLVADGVKEIVLTGIHTAGYGEDLEDYNFAQLLKEIDQIEGLERIRISSIEISQITEEVLAVMKNSTKIVDHLHVPIQAGSDEVLKKMRRHYTIAEFKQKIFELRSIFPHLAVTTDIIVGFPTESDQNFEDTKNNLAEIGFSELHIFPYSVRSGTPAAKMEQVNDQVKKDRVHELMELNNQLASKYAEMFEGDVVDILVESRNKKGLLEGYSSNYLRVEFEGDDDLIGKIIPVEIISAKYPKNIGQIV